MHVSSTSWPVTMQLLTTEHISLCMIGTGDDRPKHMESYDRLYLVMKGENDELRQKLEGQEAAEAELERQVREEMREEIEDLEKRADALEVLALYEMKNRKRRTQQERSLYAWIREIYIYVDDYFQILITSVYQFGVNMHGLEK